LDRASAAQNHNSNLTSIAGGQSGKTPILDRRINMPRAFAAVNAFLREREEAARRAQEEADALAARRAALPPEQQPDQQTATKPSYGLFDWAPTLPNDLPGSFFQWPSALPSASPMTQGSFDMLPPRWGGQPGESPFTPRPEWAQQPPNTLSPQ
jgi:hypothetical protein